MSATETRSGLVIEVKHPLVQHKLAQRWPRFTAVLMASGPDLRAIAAALKLPAPPAEPPP